MDTSINDKKKVGARNWFSFIIIGFAGALAWMVENMYLNKFIFSFGGSDYTSWVSLTVALSAITACVTTIIMGALSDKLGKRKIFICVGYILWGIATAAFGLVHKSSTINAATASMFVVILDCVMTFFGSTANDACFNSYVTKNVDDQNRGRVEGVLSILPLVAMLILSFGMDSLTSGKETHWDIFFYIVGGLAFAVGILSFFLLPKEKVDKSDEKYFSILADGFKPRVIKKNKDLYIAFLCYLIFAIGCQVFFPYMVIYFQYSLQLDGTIYYTIVLGCVLVVGSALSVIAGWLMDKFGKVKTLIPIILVAIVGLVLLYFVAPGNWIFALIAGVIMMFGYISVGAVLSAIIRELIPKGKEGIFQGVRMIFVVMLPMVTGPYIGQALTDNLSTLQYTDTTYGTVQNLPPALIWLVGAGFLVLALIPAIILLVRQNKRKKQENDGLIYDQDTKD